MAAPTDPSACFRRGLQAHQRGELAAARTAYAQALALAPDYWSCRANLAEVLQALHEPAGAIAELTRALQDCPPDAVPDRQALLLRLARLQRVQGRPAEALQTLAALPESPDALRERARAQRALGQLPAARTSLQLAAHHAPSSAHWRELASLSQQVQDWESALAETRRALQLLPGDDTAQRDALQAQIGSCLQELNRPEAALEALAQAHGPLSRLTAAGVFPVVHADAQGPARWLARYDDALSALERDPLPVLPQPLSLPGVPFYLPYQGEPVRARQERLSQIVRPLLPGFVSGRVTRRPGPWRIGCVSRYWFSHSVMRCFEQVLKALAQPPCELHALLAGPSVHDATTAALQAVCRSWTPLRGPLTAQLAQIAALDLDLLLYTDTGLDPQTWLLSHYRLAPRQLLLPGQPLTSGVSTLDGFLSDRVSEAPGAQAHYSERLLLLPEPPTDYPRPAWPSTWPTPLPGLPAGHLYLCPGQLFKFHPEMDVLLAGILAADPQAQILLLQQQPPALYRDFWARWQHSLGDGLRRVHLLPRQNADDFARLLQQVAVVLETRPFGSGNTVMAALAVGTPVITWPSETLAGRYAQAFLQQLGVTDTVVGSAEGYIACAVALATQPDQRAALSQRLLAGAAQLFDNPRVGPMVRDALLQEMDGL